MKGIIVSFRRGRHVTSPNQMLVKVLGIDSKAKASSLAGKKVIWKAKTKEIHGVITRAHGSKGVVRVRFHKGMPGQSLGKEVEIL